MEWAAQLPRSFSFRLSGSCRSWASPNVTPRSFFHSLFSLSYFFWRGRAAFHLRYLLIGLVAVSVVINSLTTVSWLVEADQNVPAETRAKWNEFLGRTSRR